ncbi:beta-glucosidase [Sinomonas atrocyanea]|uniref:glycoside hydrolase family 3 N-terminal domain-containing protein n=1 Tax=Sinomonas atrocyanea TaxID=37927 RepID=UPI0027881195|nr:glycoside hydrolase family 3 N-terminal domain-containing protein [Sinomonas atrocyanea]MDP9884538.1 beta-glucosidase [Sinomonas atrocyanea]
MDIEDLLSRMSWEQKLGQLQIVWRKDPAEQRALVKGGLGAVFWPPSAAATNELQRIAVEETELGIPLLIALDVVHGQFTIFPTPLAQAASFDPEVARSDARASAEEARAAGVNWTFSPMVDVTRDPRWGRVVEGFGEDVFLASGLAAAKVAGYQGSGLAEETTVASCLKHFVAYGAAEAGRDYNTTDISERRLRETYLETFRVGVEQGAASVMAAFNSLNGRPMHANRRLLTGVLKEEWGFDGLVVGDADGVAQLVDHGVAADEREAIRLAIEAGVDVVMGGTLLVDAEGTPLLSPGELSQERVDDAVRRVLRLKERLGLFDRPFVDESREATAATAERRATARGAAERCIVLLKNDPGRGRERLPLPPRGRILLAGPYARSLDHLGAWVQRFATPVAAGLADALAAELPGVDWDVAEGADFFDPSEEAVAEAVERAREADLVVLAVGEPSRISGEASSRSDIALPGAQSRLIQAVAATGVPVVVVLVTGRPLVVEDWIDRVDSVLCTWHLGLEAPAAIAAALSGRVNPGGRVPMTFPRAVGQIPIYHDHERTGRPPQLDGMVLPDEQAEFAGPNNTFDYYTSKFIDLPLGPRFDFGHGLSYTTFELSDLTVSPDRLREQDDGAGTAEVSVTVRNTGTVDGDDVVLLFVTDAVASVAQPVRRLRGYRRVALPAGGSARLSFTLAVDDLCFWADGTHRITEPGEFSITVSDGASTVSHPLFLA